MGLTNYKKPFCLRDHGQRPKLPYAPLVLANTASDTHLELTPSFAHCTNCFSLELHPQGFQCQQTSLALMGDVVQINKCSMRRETWAEHLVDRCYFGAVLEHNSCHHSFVTKLLHTANCHTYQCNHQSKI